MQKIQQNVLPCKVNPHMVLKFVLVLSTYNLIYLQIPCSSHLSRSWIRLCEDQVAVPTLFFGCSTVSSLCITVCSALFILYLS